MLLPLQENEYVLWIPKNEIWKVLDYDWDGVSSTTYFLERVYPGTPAREWISDAMVSMPVTFKRLTEMEVLAWAAREH